MAFLESKDYKEYIDVIKEVNGNIDTSFDWMVGYYKNSVIGLTRENIVSVLKGFGSNYYVVIIPLSSIVVVDTYRSDAFGEDLFLIFNSGDECHLISYDKPVLKDNYDVILDKIKEAVLKTEYEALPTTKGTYNSKKHTVKIYENSSHKYVANEKRIYKEYIESGKINEYIIEAQNRDPNSINSDKTMLQSENDNDEFNNNNQAKNIFMNVDLDELVNKHTIDGKFLLNGCAKELVELTSIDIDDAKEILKDVVETPKQEINIQEHIDQAPIEGVNENLNESNIGLKKQHRNALVCPRCHSQNVIMIEGNPGGTRISANLNPLHPLTPLKTKKKKKKVHSKGKLAAGVMTGGLSLLVTGTKKKVDAEFICKDCGKKFYR